MEANTFDFTKRFVRLVHDAYGMPFDEAEYEGRSRALPEETGKD